MSIPEGATNAKTLREESSRNIKVTVTVAKIMRRGVVAKSEEQRKQWKTVSVVL